MGPITVSAASDQPMRIAAEVKDLDAAGYDRQPVAQLHHRTEPLTWPKVLGMVLAAVGTLVVHICGRSASLTEI